MYATLHNENNHFTHKFLVAFQVLLAGSITDSTIWLYHIPTQSCLQVFVGHDTKYSSNGGVTSGCFTPTGKQIITIGMDGTLRLWAPKSGSCLHVFQLKGGLLCMDTHGGLDEQLVVIGGDDGNAHIVHIKSRKVIATLRHDECLYKDKSENVNDSEITVETVKFAPKAINSLWVATGGSDGRIKLWDLTHGDNCQCRLICQLESHDINVRQENTRTVTRLVWHPYLPLILASYSDGIVRFWDVRNGTVIYCLTGGEYERTDCQINDMFVGFQESGSKSVVVTGNDKGVAKVYQVDVRSIWK